MQTDCQHMTPLRHRLTADGLCLMSTFMAGFGGSVGMFDSLI